LLSLGAQAKVVGPQGEREVDVNDFFAGPRRTCLGRGEFVKELHIPAPKERTAGVFMRVSPRRAMDCSVAAVAATVSLGSAGVIEEVKIGLGAVAPKPIRAKSAEEVLVGQKPTTENLLAAGKAAAGACQPIEDIRGSVEYRREMVQVLVKRAVEEVCRRASL